VPETGIDQTPAMCDLCVGSARTTFLGANDPEVSLKSYEASAPTYELPFGNCMFEHLRTIEEDLLFRIKLLRQSKGN
jgi:hypothetical protein